MHHHSFLPFICAPVVAVSCIVSPPAQTADGLEAGLNELDRVLSARYSAAPQWLVLSSYIKNMRSSGNANWTDRSGNNLLACCLASLPDCDASLVHKILLAGLDPNQAEPATGMTSLHRAALAGDYRMALRLLAFGAKADTNDKKGHRPIELTRHPQLRALLRRGFPVELQSDEALEAWEKACRGDSAAMWKLSRYYNDDTGIHSAYISKWAKAEQGSDVDELEKIAWVEQAASKGEAEAQFDLGLRLVYGKGVPQNTEKGYHYLRSAAASGLETARDFLNDNPYPES